MIKKIVLLLILSFAFTAHAQFRNGQRNGQRQQRQGPMTPSAQKAPKPNFKVEKYIGIVIYDVKKAAKKSSIKLSSKEGKEFSKILTKYNKDIKDIKRINSFLLRNTKEMVENYQKKAMKSGDFSNQVKIQKQMNESLKPIGNAIKEEDKKLDKKMTVLLSEKQYKKWIKYNKKKYKVFPKEKEE